MEKMILIICFMPFLLSSTCESDPIDDAVCTTQAFAGLQVKVSLQNRNLPNPSGVNVIARDNNYSETLIEIGIVHTDFVGAYERKGTYIINVLKNGYIL